LRRLLWLSLLVWSAAARGQLPEYEGPEILSRGLGTGLARGAERIQLRPYVAVNGIYDSGMTPVSLDSQGRTVQEDVYGVEANLGLLGYRTWRRTILGVDYRGNVRHYTRHTYYDGSDQMLGLGLTHQATRRLAISLREAAGTYARDFAGLSAAGFYDPRFANVPSNELFDGRTYYTSSMADLTFQKSSRLSFNFGGTGLLVRRRARQLIGVTAGLARADMAYRVSRNQTLGIDYGYSHYAYTNAFGASDIHSAAGDYAVLLSRNWRFGLRGGVARVETLGLRRVSIDPIIAAIIRQTVGVQVFHQINYVPVGEASLFRTVRRSTVSFMYQVGADYGNGVYLTSKRQSATASLSFTATKSWNIGFFGGYDTYSSLGQTLGKYEGYQGGGGFTYKLVRSFHLIGRFDARHYEILHTGFGRETYRGTLGFAFSPGDFPLPLW